MGGLSIGELARKTGVNIETIRYFEKIGMLGAPERTAGGHRVFDDGHLRTLKFIKRARELGFAPKEVRTLLDLGGPAKACCCLLYTSPSPRDKRQSRMPSSA